MCYKVQIQVVDDSMANRLRIAHDSYVNHALLSCCYDESTLDSIHQFGRFLFMVTLDWGLTLNGTVSHVKDFLSDK